MNEWKTQSGDGITLTVRLRAADLFNHDDLESAMDMEVALMRELYRRRKMANEGYTDFDEGVLRGQIASELDLNERRLRFIFALVDEREKGCARYHFSCDGKGNHISLDTLYVHPAVRGRGVGTRVIEAIKGEARFRHVDRIQLNADTYVVPYYEQHGFKVAGTQKSGDKNRPMFFEVR